MLKVIDFGVAKALELRPTDKTVFTGYWQLLGTPAYMSPEQAALSGLEIDGRADVYSLGVLLYELLTGVTPFDKTVLREAPLEEIRRLLLGAEPPKPSARLQALGDRLNLLAMRRHAEPAALLRRVRGDLDSIVMQCLEKDRERRYATPAALAEDVSRHLKNQPIQARPPSVPYVLGKYLRRHRLPVAVASAVVVTLLLSAMIVGALGLRRPHPIPPAKVPAAPVSARQVPGQPVPPEQRGQWEVLFDGTSIDAFHGYGQEDFPHHRWWVTPNGELRAMGGDSPSHIITHAQFDDFELTWEWAVEPGGNGGVLYRVAEYYNQPWQSGPEYQLIDDDQPDNSLAVQKSGAVYGLIAPTNKLLKPIGQWNQSRLLVQTNHVEHWLNGQRIAEYELDSAEFNSQVASSQFRAYPQFAKARKGGIVLQNWTAEIWYRNIKVRRLQ